ncbi:hypothetical protein [Bailinhaonella thermotolerans]|uniref:CobQ/CobB/MinD/ParA nucleotide binding domain-containing protein n=1 Tax=Bailinhaonella thermotolerans TaxID=1070861 RepID=A0A3A4A4V9_9ACTN|nr:hypothetical protein [Bailinhaonella thermotolerans]RJL20180.1 hypothetical protein D5H75_39725 [Bailinhaonella thermotolerans]
MIVVVAGGMGGTGRTTTALGMAAAAAADQHPVTLIDSDRGGYATAVVRDVVALAELLQAPVKALAGEPSEVLGWVAARAPGGEVVVVDLPPGDQSDAVCAADMVVIPVPPPQRPLRQLAPAEPWSPRPAPPRPMPYGLQWADIDGIRYVNPRAEVIVLATQVGPSADVAHLRHAAAAQGVRTLESVIPHSRALQSALAGGALRWDVFADLYREAWHELRPSSADR